MSYAKEVAAWATATGADLRPGSAIVLSEFLNENAPYPHCHASTIAETAPGRLVAAWFGGTHEGAPDVSIWLARQVEGHWQSAVEVATGIQPDGSRHAAWNPVLFHSPHGELFLFYKLGRSPRRWWGMVMTSPDGGITWSEPRRLPPGILGPIKNKPVVLPDGAWLAGSSTEGPLGRLRVYFELSRDAGHTWKEIGRVAKGGFAAIQPTVLSFGDGTLEAFCRTRQRVIAKTRSSDGGHTWTPLEGTALPNPNSAIDALALADGRRLLVYNHSPQVPGSRANRYPLDVAISRNGATWKHVLTLEDQPRPSGYAYPAVIQTSDGLVHITYTWDRQLIKHVAIDLNTLK